MKVSGISNKKVVMSQNSSKGVKNIAVNFSQSLELADKNQQDRELKQMLKDIEMCGKRLASTRSLDDAEVYKNKIQQYLSFIVKNVYVLRREPGPMNYGVHIKIEVINQKLDELTKDILDKEKPNIEIADKISEIKGLLIDAYK